MKQSLSTGRLLLLLLVGPFGILYILKQLAPENLISFQFVIITLFLFTLTVISLHKIYNLAHKINGGIIAIAGMFIFFFIGSINYFVVKFIFPGYSSGIENTALYWSCCTICFIVGYIIKFSARIEETKTYQHSSNLVLHIFIILGLAATFFSISQIGFIPSLIRGAGLTDRYGTGTILPDFTY